MQHRRSLLHLLGLRHHLRVSSDTLLMGDLGNNDVDVIAGRLRQLPPEQFRVVREVINRLLELTTLSQ